MEDPKVARRRFLRRIATIVGGLAIAPMLGETAEADDRRWRWRGWGWRGNPNRGRVEWGRRTYVPRGTYYVAPRTYVAPPPTYVAPPRRGLFQPGPGPRPLPGYYPPML
jgi:hypothetical protein